jgi:hypothetical protein
MQTLGAIGNSMWLSTVCASWWGVCVPLAIALVMAVGARLIRRHRIYVYGFSWLPALIGLIAAVTLGHDEWQIRTAVVLGGLAVLSAIGSGLVFQGITSALAVGAASVAAGLVIRHLGWMAATDLGFVASTCALLCGAWMLCAVMVSRFARLWPALFLSPTFDVLKIAGLACGLGAVLTRVLDATMLLTARFLSPYDWLSQLPAPAAGLFDLLAVLIGIVLWRCCGRSALQTISAFWVAVVLVIWSGLMVPPNLEIVATRWPAWMPWTLWIQVGLTGLVAAFVPAGLGKSTRQWRREWPDRLYDLIRPKPEVPGLREAIGIISVTVLMLGVFHVLNLPKHCRTAAAITFLCAVALAVSNFRLVGVRWSVNLAEVGIGVATLAGATLPIIIYPVDTSRELSPQIPILLNTVLFGLVFMVWLWHWLAAVWRQQLFGDNQAWTTAGHLSSVVLRVGFMVGALALMLSLLMALWPDIGLHVSTSDASAGRWVAGVLAHVALVVVLVWSARSSGKVTLGWAAVVAMIVLGQFVAVRLHHGRASLWLTMYWPLVWASSGVLIWVVGRVSARTSWSVLAGPLACAGLALPAVGLLGLLATSSMGWVMVLTSLLLVMVIALQWAGTDMGRVLRPGRPRDRQDRLDR